MNLLKWILGCFKKAPVSLPPEFLEEAPPDWLIECRGRALPNGDAFSIRVILFQTSRTGSAEIVTVPREAGAQAPPAKADLERGEIDRLLVILGFSFPQDFAAVRSEIPDGLPVEIAIHRREPYSAAGGTCNLAPWLEAKKTGPPTVEVGRLLIELMRRVTSTPGDGHPSSANG